MKGVKERAHSHCCCSKGIREGFDWSGLTVVFVAAVSLAIFEQRALPLSAVKEIAALMRGNIEDADFCEHGIRRLCAAFQGDPQKYQVEALV